MYKRVLLKMSGEALKGSGTLGIDPNTVKSIAEEIKILHENGVEIGIVCGGGNLWRGKTGEELGMDRAQADYMGMLATIMNSLAIQEALEKQGVDSRVLSSLNVNDCCEPYIRRRAMRHLEKGRVVILAGGTGSPYFTTDTASALKAAEIEAEAILMAKNGVDGVYDDDPRKNPNAKLFKEVTYQEILDKKLQVMDLTAVTISAEHHLEFVVFNMNTKGNIVKAGLGEDIGTKVH